MSNKREQGSALALLPLGVFLVLFIGSGIISGDFYKMSTLVAFTEYFHFYLIEK